MTPAVRSTTHKAVGAYQILVSVNPLVKRDGRNVFKTTKEFLSNYKYQSNSAIFSSEDSGFIELKHDFKFQSGQSRRGPHITIKAYDPGMGFLNDLYFDFVGRSLSRMNDDKDKEQMHLRGLYEKIKPFEEDTKKTLTRIEGIENDDAARSREAGLAAGGTLLGQRRGTAAQILSGEDPYLEDLLTDLRKRVGEIQQDDMAPLQEQIQAIISYRTLPKVYIMYGVGEDLNDWAGPFETYLGEIRHDNDGKSETTEYMFAVDLTTAQYRDADLFKEKSKGEKRKFFDKVAVPIMCWNYNSGATKTYLHSVDFPGHPTNFHDCIVKLISNYLFRIGIKNHLVVLPNLNSLLAPLISSVLKNLLVNDTWLAKRTAIKTLSETSTGRRGSIYSRKRGGVWVSEYWDVDPNAMTLPWDGKTGEEAEAALLDFMKDLFHFGPRRDSGTVPPKYHHDSFLGDAGTVPASKTRVILLVDLFDLWGGSGQTSGEDRVAPDRIMRRGRDELMSESAHNYLNGIGNKIIQRVFEGIGLKAPKAEGRSSSVDPALGVTIEKGEDPDSFEANDVKCTNPFDIIPLAAGKWEFGEVVGSTLMRVNFAGAEEDDEGPKDDWVAPIKKIFNGLNGVAANNIINFDDGYVSDVTLKAMLHDQFGGGTYVGYGSIRASRAIDDTSLYIIGDRDLIQLLVYGRLALNIRKNQAAFTDRDYLSEKGDFPMMMVNMASRGPLDDIFWRNIGKEISMAIQTTHPGARGASYLFKMYNYLHPGDGGMNLGYHTGYMENWKQLKTMLPDEFGYARTDDVVKDIFEFNIPIFLANTLNSNILSYSFDVNKFIYGAMFGSMQEIYYNVSKRTLSTGWTKGSDDLPTLKAKVNEIITNMKARTGFFGMGMSTATGIGTPVDTEELMDNLAKIMYLEGTTGTHVSIRRGKGSASLQFILMFLEIFERQYIGTVKTLPMFHLSNHSYINQPAIAVLKSTRAIGLNPGAGLGGNTTTRESVSDFLSGMYRILGFSHTITTTSAFSEFNLVKDIIGELNNENVT